MDKCLQQEIAVIRDSLKSIRPEDTTTSNDRAMNWIRIHAKRFREAWQREHLTEAPFGKKQKR